VILGDVFVAPVLRAQRELEVDAFTVAVMAQRISDDFLNRFLLEQPARDGTGQIGDARLDDDPVTRLVCGGVELVELRHDPVNGARQRHLAELRRVLAKHLAQVVGVWIDRVNHEPGVPPQHLIHRNVGDRTRELDVIAVETADAFIALKLQHRERRRMRREFYLVRLGRHNHRIHQRIFLNGYDVPERHNT
jgi:hypothetical protein